MMRIIKKKKSSRRFIIAANLCALYFWYFVNRFFLFDNSYI